MLTIIGSFRGSLCLEMTVGVVNETFKSDVR